MSRVSRQVFIILAFALTLFFTWDLSQRVVTNVRLAETEKQLELQVAHAQATRAALVGMKTRVQTDAYVEEKVRREWHYAREGEVVVIAQITPAPTPLPSAPSPTPTPQPSTWQSLSDFFSGVLNFLFGP